jgi:hypothetical protein
MALLGLLGNSLRWKLWRRRLSVAAPAVTIRTRVPWPLQTLLMLAVIGLAGALVLRAYDLGRDFTGLSSAPDVGRISALEEENDQLRVERDKLATTVNAAESQLNMERAAQRQLVTQLKALEVENTKLKEDLAFFDSLLPAAVGVQGISIRRLTADLIAPNQLRYRILVMQSAKAKQDFVGELQLMVAVLREGDSAIIVFPDEETRGTNNFKLAFRHYQRIEGVLTLPEGVSTKSVQARILERGQIRTQQSAIL